MQSVPGGMSHIHEVSKEGAGTAVSRNREGWYGWKVVSRRKLTRDGSRGRLVPGHAGTSVFTLNTSRSHQRVLGRR